MYFHICQVHMFATRGYIRIFLRTAKHYLALFVITLSINMMCVPLLFVIFIRYACNPSFYTSYVSDCFTLLLFMCFLYAFIQPWVNLSIKEMLECM